MINRTNGDIAFSDGFIIRAQEVFRPMTDHQPFPSQPLPLSGWFRYKLGVRETGHGSMESEAVCGPDGRVHLVLLAHTHPFYETSTPDDSERKTYHEGIVATDLSGQWEFSWGVVHCQTDPKENKNWLVIVYTPGANFSLSKPELLLQLFAREK